MQKRHVNREQYFYELAKTSEKYFIPFIEKYKIVLKNDSILEIGCGEGGNLLPFAKRGCNITGIDISINRVLQAKKFFAQEKVDAAFIHGDIFKHSTIRERERERENQRLTILSSFMT